MATTIRVPGAKGLKTRLTRGTLEKSWRVGEGNLSKKKMGRMEERDSVRRSPEKGVDRGIPL